SGGPAARARPQRAACCTMALPPDRDHPFRPARSRDTLERSITSKRCANVMSRGAMRGLYGIGVTRSRSGQASPSAAGQVTIQDVARAAGVGRQTVSNVLNGSGRVGEATKARVLDAVTTLGYHPHHGARSLRSRRTRQLAYVMPPLQLLPGNYIMQQFL